MTTKTLTQLFLSVEKTPKRLEMQAILGDFFSHCTPQEAAISSYLLIGRVVPQFIPVEFQLAEKTLSTAVELVLGKSIEAESASLGDLGLVWEKFAPLQDKELDIVELYKKLWEIAGTKGQGSQKKKQELIATLLSLLSPLSGKYVLRILNGKLRLGASERTILEALGKLEGGDLERLKQLFADTSDIGHTVFLFLTFGEGAYAKGTFVPGVPISAKLVSPEKSLEAIFKRIPQPYLEPKYDGLRIQIHVSLTSALQSSLENRVWHESYQQFQINQQEPITSELTLFSTPSNNTGKETFNVSLFSRNLENMTDMFPEVVAAAKLVPLQYQEYFQENIESIVLDGEVIGYNDELEEYLSFSDTMTRKRKYGITATSEQTPAKVFVFDILLVNGNNLTQVPLSQRKQKLAFLDKSFPNQSVLRKTPYATVNSIDEAAEIFEKYMEEGLEGVIFKNPLSVYGAGVRNYEWIKFKRDMVEEHKLTDSLDVVVVGYFFGKGRLAKMGVGKILTALYDDKNDVFLSFTKVGTKMTDEQRLELRRRCDEFKVADKPERIHVSKNLVPDVWMYPGLVVEITGYEISQSINPSHVAGYSLRFPKFLKYREKKPEQATTVAEIGNIVKELQK